MEYSQSFAIVYTTIVAVLAASALLSLFAWGAARRTSNTGPVLHIPDQRVSFLFDGTQLIDASVGAKKLLDKQRSDQSDWSRFLAAFLPSFPQLKDRGFGASRAGKVRLISPVNVAQSLEIERSDGITRFVFFDADQDNEDNETLRLELEAFRSEVRTLEAIADQSPQLIWKEDGGRIDWANRAYLDESDKISEAKGRATSVWPPEHIFRGLTRPARNHSSSTARVSLNSGDRKEWYEITSVRRGESVVHFALNATALVRAEASQQAFTQTLGRTFADLSTALAVFNHKRELISFNPALCDMVGLNPAFLAQRPSAHEFLSYLNDSGFISGLESSENIAVALATFEAQAKTVGLQAEWKQANGRTIKVNARPHPNGAFAFVFEDISAEKTLYRKFEEERILSRVVLDNLAEATAVFAKNGHMLFCNRSYQKLWDSPLASTLSSTLDQEERRWAKALVVDANFGGLAAAAQSSSSVEFTQTLNRVNAPPLQAKVKPLPGQKTLVTFSDDVSEWSDRPPVFMPSVLKRASQ